MYGLGVMLDIAKSKVLYGPTFNNFLLFLLAIVVVGSAVVKTM